MDQTSVYAKKWKWSRGGMYPFVEENESIYINIIVWGCVIVPRLDNDKNNEIIYLYL